MDQLTYADGAPVRVGDIVMSLDGPKLVDGIEYEDGGWRLWAEFSLGFGKLKRLYIIDEGAMDGLTFPVRATDALLDPWDNGWIVGDEIVPSHVFIGVPSWLADVIDGMDHYVEFTPDELVHAITERTAK